MRRLAGFQAWMRASDDGPVLGSSEATAAGLEVVVDAGVDGQETLGVAR